MISFAANYPNWLDIATVLMLKQTVFCLSFLCTFSLWGNSRMDTIGGSAVFLYGFSLYSGTFIKHSPKLTTHTGQRVPGAEISIAWQSRGRKQWQIAHHFPMAGAAFIWQQPGAGAHGHLFGFFPHLTLRLARMNKWGAFFRVGTGIAYAQRPHSTFDNPNENALGSHFNNITQYRVGLVGQAGQHWQIGLGFKLTHFSNGGYEQPNFGMNIPGFYCAVNRLKAPVLFQQQLAVNMRPHRRWGAALQMNLSQIEYVSPDGPKYLLWACSGAGTYMFHRYNRGYFGAELEHNNGVEAWLFNNTLLGNDRDAASKGARRLGVFVADEFLFGPLGIYVQASYHVGKSPWNTFAISKNYNKLSVRYYFDLCKNGTLKTHIGLSLKAYKAVAESISVTSGLAF